MTEAEQAVIDAARAWRAVQRDYDKLNDLLLTTRDQRQEEALNGRRPRQGNLIESDYPNLRLPRTGLLGGDTRRA